MVNLILARLIIRLKKKLNAVIVLLLMTKCIIICNVNVN